MLRHVLSVFLKSLLYCGFPVIIFNLRIRWAIVIEFHPLSVHQWVSTRTLLSSFDDRYRVFFEYHSEDIICIACTNACVIPLEEKLFKLTFSPWQWDGPMSLPRAIASLHLRQVLLHPPASVSISHLLLWQLSSLFPDHRSDKIVCHFLIESTNMNSLVNTPPRNFCPPSYK